MRPEVGATVWVRDASPNGGVAGLVRSITGSVITLDTGSAWLMFDYTRREVRPI